MFIRKPRWSVVENEINIFRKVIRFRIFSLSVVFFFFSYNSFVQTRTINRLFLIYKFIDGCCIPFRYLITLNFTLKN